MRSTWSRGAGLIAAPDDSDVGLLNLATATPVATGTASVSNTIGEAFSLTSSLFTSHTSFLPIATGPTNTSASRVYYGIPYSLLIGTDVQQLTARATASTGSNIHVRTVSKFFTSVGAIDLPMGAPMPEPEISIAGTTNYVRMRGIVLREPGYRSFANFTFQQTLATGVRQVSISATGGYFPGSADFDITMPDWHGLANWQDTYGLQSGNDLFWLVTGNGWSVPGGILSPTPVRGTVVKSATYTGNFNIP